MIDAKDVPADKLLFTTRLIRDHALERGWKVWMYYVGSSNMRIQRTDGTILELFSAAPPTTSYVAAHRADDKFFTHLTLQEADLPVLETYLVNTLEQALEKAVLVFSQKLQCVVKPLDAGHGNGITVAVANATDLQEAFAHAQQFSNSVIIQAHVEQPIDIRITCIDYQYVAAMVRIPARVKGDGVHTADELIELENAKKHRGENYTEKLNRISKERAGLYLGEELQAVPKKDEWLQVLGTANVGTGGETVDVTDELPAWLIEQAQHAARVAQLPLVGIDFLVKAMPTKEMSREALDPVVIEVNKCPSLFIHETPTYGRPRPVTETYLDYLATL